MPRETIAQRLEREQAEAQARYEASRIPATIADVRPLSVGVRSEINGLASARSQIIDDIRWLARGLIEEADRLEKDTDREPSQSLLNGSLPHDIADAIAAYNAKAKVLASIVSELAAQGVDLPGITIVKDRFARTKLHASWEG